MLHRKLQNVLPRRVIVRVEVDLPGGKGGFWVLLLRLAVRRSTVEDYATWLTAGTSFPVLTMRCNHSRVKLLTPMLLQATRRDVEQDNKLIAHANFGGRTWTALPLWP